MVPPTAPEKVMRPVPATRLRVCAPAELPSTVPPKEMAPFAALVVMAVVPAKVRSVLVLLAAAKELAVMLLPMVRPVVLEEVQERAPRRVVAPTVLERVMAPAPAVRVRSWAPALEPLTVPPKEMAPPAALVLTVELPEKSVFVVEAAVKEFAVMLLATVSPVGSEEVQEKAPTRVVPPTAPERVMAPVPAFRVRSWAPALDPLIVPAKEMAPPAVLVLMVEVPERSVFVVPAAVNELAVISLPMVSPVVSEEVQERAPKRVDPPTALDRTMGPVPALRVNACRPAPDPSTVPPKEMVPPAVLVLTVVVPTKTRRLFVVPVVAKELAVMLLPMVTPVA